MRYCWLALVWVHTVAIQSAELRSLLSAPVHLGTAGNPEWDIFDGKSPIGKSLHLQFEGTPNPKEFTLLLRQDDVKQDWTVTLNGNKLGSLFLMEADLHHALPIPSGTLRNGTNDLTITTKSPEDILIREIHLAESSFEGLFTTEEITVQVVDENGEAIPSRITIVDRAGTMASILPSKTDKLAVRPGVIYTANGSADFRLREGQYSLYATRGPEYSLAATNLVVIPGREANLRLRIQRELLTTGWVASDTHIHTVTLSGHGDATLAERVITLAGEGVEMPVCTEHNLHADYTATTRKLGLEKYFTPVPGNEVTTKKGHFNIFPVSLTAPPPDAKIESWPDLLKVIRRTPNVQVVILNHPTDTHSGFTPFAITNLHPESGRNLQGFDFDFDAIEVVNSGAMRSDWMEPFRRWFALLNYGNKITAVGASDSHDVSRFIVGQGRTYIRADDSEANRINVADACDALKSGRAGVSLGLFPELVVEDSFGPGDLVPGEDEIVVEARVLGPTWMRAEKLELFANGQQIKEFRVNPSDANKVEKGNFRWTLPKRGHDYHLILIASGPGVTEPYWSVARPYQPTAKHWDPVLIGATNPIWIDADRDGKFTSPRAYAQAIIAKDGDTAEAIRELDRYDFATAIQYFDLLNVGAKLEKNDLERAIATGKPFIREAWNAYLGE